MNGRVLLTVVECIGNEVLAIAVGEEVYGTRGDDADKRRAESSKQRWGAFKFLDISTQWPEGISKYHGL